MGIRDGVTDVWQRFTAVTAVHPQRAAVIAGESTLTFGELGERVESLAAELARRGVGRGSVVGVCLPRCTDLIAAMLAAWRVGAAYLPLDPADPVDRRTWMLHDAGAQLVISRGDALLAAGEPGALDVAAPLRNSPAAPVTAGSPLDLAYVIYTSGSTGTPKGVQVCRGAVARLVQALEEAGAYPAAPSRVACNASVCFDASVQQWVRVSRGDTVLLVPAEVRTDPEAFTEFLLTREVTDVDLTPTHLALVGEHLEKAVSGRGRRLRLFVGGEPLPARWWSRLAASTGLEALNLYGPTECTVDATVTAVRGTAPHIGWPLPGVAAYVLDDGLRPVPGGAVGELYLSGPGLARGYVRQPALTARTFVADPLVGDGRRMYRTGDLVRRRGDGGLEFVARADRQLKLRGFRIEPGEVEAALQQHPAVSGVLVDAVDTPAGPSLVAYYLGEDEAERLDLRRHTEDRLPAHMVPAIFHRLDAFPVTRSGKVDRTALPVPATAPLPAGRDSPDAPVGPVETVLAEVWRDVLGLDGPVGRMDNFFSLGGHSLGALRVAAAVHKRLPIRMVTRTIYQFPVLRDLAEQLAPPVVGTGTAPAARTAAPTDPGEQGTDAG
ncbi:MAG: hypothetical protein QOE03_3309 [Micromonosporaceae bacterium]|nr:hypothetical protein [Micromonosporaceae bacterium]